MCGHGHANSGSIYNCPGEFPYDPRLVYILDKIADYYYPNEVRIRPIHSGFRCYAHNTALHNDPGIRASYNSNHRFGRAADISIAGVNLNTLEAVARRFGAAADTYTGGSFVHIAVPILAPRTLTINSPVDVFIYDNDGRLVGRIVDNVVDALIEYEGVSVSVGYNNVKYMSFFTTRNYTARVVATNYGTMTYAVEDFNVPTMQRVANRRFEDVELLPGRVFVSEITDAHDVRLLLVEDDIVVGEILPTGAEYISVTDEGNDAITLPEQSNLSQSQQQNLSQRPPQNNTESVIILLAAIVLVLLLAGTITFLYIYKKKKRQQPQISNNQTEKSNKTFCTKCGKKIATNKNFCTGCGANITK